MKVSDLNEQQLRELEILLEYNSKQILKTGYHTNFRYGVRSNNPRLAVFLVFFNVMDQIHSIYCVASNYKVISLLPGICRVNPGGGATCAPLALQAFWPQRLQAREPAGQSA